MCKDFNLTKVQLLCAMLRNACSHLLHSSIGIAPVRAHYLPMKFRHTPIDKHPDKISDVCSSLDAAKYGLYLCSDLTEAIVHDTHYPGKFFQTVLDYSIFVRVIRALGNVDRKLFQITPHDTLQVERAFTGARDIELAILAVAKHHLGPKANEMVGIGHLGALSNV
jgi:hypothetical protein